MSLYLVDLKTQYQNHKKEIDKAIQTVINKTNFILGEEVELFEEEFAKFCGTKYCIGVSTGTDALEMILKAYGVKKGDEVITVANTFIATVLGISQAGATPVLVDMDEKTYNMNPDLIEEKITKKTKAIMPVHLYGQICDIEKISKIAKKHNLLLIEDACQAHNAICRNKKAGNFGNAAAFSFYPGKNLGAFGDGGAIVTNSKKMAEKFKMMRNYGQKIKYHHLTKGGNHRLDTLQAAILRVKLKYLEKWSRKRRENAKIYNELLENSPVKTPEIPRDEKKHVFHLYVIQAPQREKLIEYLNEKEIYPVIHYPIPIHLQKAYKDLEYKKGDFPVCEAAAEKILSLPMYPELTREEIEFICEQIMNFYSKDQRQARLPDRSVGAHCLPTEAL